MKIFNTMTRSKEEFKPLEEGKVKMYVCGPTVYNYIHVGNARPFIIFDTLRRYLEYRGYEVTYVQNFTDVDDKIIKRGHEENIPPEEVAKKYIEEYFVDADGLGIKRATVHPQVTNNIEEIIEFVKELEDKGYAYAVNGDVYFDTQKFNDYGKLSGIKQDELEAGSRIEVNDQKRHPMDFVLWKAKKEGEPGWMSPWGEGRPGWHIECSVMSRRYLGDTIDIHAGGQDLKFPHHENEIAQSMAYHHHPIADVWMHNQMININNQKMSKSLGNVLWAKDLLEELGCNVYKWLMLSTHYRNPLNFTDDVLNNVKKEVEKVENILKQTSLYLQVHRCINDDYRKETVDTMVEALADDLNTSLALTQILGQVKVLNQVMRTREKDDRLISLEYQTLIHMLDTMGFIHDTKTLNEEDIVLYQQWMEEKSQKNFEKADELRSQLQAKGII